MSFNLLKYLLILPIAFTVVPVFGQKQSKKTVTKSRLQRNRDVLQIDTSITVIIPFSFKWYYPFDSSYRKAALIQKDIKVIDSLMINSITNYNNSLDSNFEDLRIDLVKYNYKRQLIAVINNSGEKEVWVNCLCETSDINWRREIMFVDDGGSCFFNFKVNLTNRKVYDWRVNSVA